MHQQSQHFYSKTGGGDRRGHGFASLEYIAQQQNEKDPDLTQWEERNNSLKLSFDPYMYTFYISIIHAMMKRKGKHGKAEKDRRVAGLRQICMSSRPAWPTEQVIGQQELCGPCVKKQSKMGRRGGGGEL